MRPSSLGSPDIEARIREIAAAYPARVPRSDVHCVEDLLAAARIELPQTTIVVVGTNGKTSTAIFLSRLLTRSGARVGVTTSPHITSWGERVAVTGRPVDDLRLADELERLHELALAAPSPESLRFFDLLTLAAAQLFSEASVDVGVFEAGIGGRLDATHTLNAQLTVLTGVARDHTELLGDRLTDILREKLGAAPQGGRVVAAGLGAELEREARAMAHASDLDLTFVRSTSGDVFDRNRELAIEGARALGADVRPDSLTWLAGKPVRGRMHGMVIDGVDVVLDAAHNPQAWQEIAPLLPLEFVAVVSVSRDRPASAVAVALGGATHVVATEAWPGRSHRAAELAAALRGAGVPADVAEDPRAAVSSALADAKARGVPLVVLGSSYLLPHAYAVLGG